jgi:hypothetical protein
VISPDGRAEFAVSRDGAPADAAAIGRAAGEDLIARAGADFLASLKAAM